MEIYTDEKNADQLISITRGFGIDARVIGRVEESNQKLLTIKNNDNDIVY
jgi:phosphoribosylformylglycinamidine cyclo-ligase